MFSPVLLVLGAGPNIGQHTARSFAAKGYKVALSARSFENGVNSEGHVLFKNDLSQPESVRELFAQVHSTVGIPSVVVYNGIRVPDILPYNPLSYD
jgi:NAD(P)-dependent dehydrogenase (short-subunit alcohol dehydrogenase family)